MSPAAQSWLQLVTAIAALAGFFAWQTHYIDKRIEDLREGLIKYMDARFKGVEDRLERLEHPVTRP